MIENYDVKKTRFQNFHHWITVLVLQNSTNSLVETSKKGGLYIACSKKWSSVIPRNSTCLNSTTYEYKNIFNLKFIVKEDNRSNK